MNKPNLSTKNSFFQLVSFINSHWIAENRQDITFQSTSQDPIGPENAYRYFPITTSLLLLNTILGKNTLIMGDSGTGKTRLAETVSSVLTRLPLEFFSYRRVMGSPGLTVNDIYATHDLSELTQGRDVAFLYLPFHLPLLVIDEINRFSDVEQNRIRQGVAEQTWNYANHSWHIDGQAVIGAMNPTNYNGTFALNENLADNFSLSLWPPLFNRIADRELVCRSATESRTLLGERKLFNDFLEFYQKNKTSQSLIQEELLLLKSKMEKQLTVREVPFLSEQQQNDIRFEIKSLEWEPEARFFFYSVLAESEYSVKFGRNRLEDLASDSASDLPFLSSKLGKGLNGRFLQDWEEAAMSVAWLCNRGKVCVSDLITSFVFASAHRLLPEKAASMTWAKENSQLPLKHRISLVVVKEVEKRFLEILGEKKFSIEVSRTVVGQISQINDVKSEDIENAELLLKDSNHPLAIMLDECLKQKSIKGGFHETFPRDEGSELLDQAATVKIGLH